jgi:alpha-1,3/alpha-1,6-mannosyltransferase
VKGDNIPRHFKGKAHIVFAILKSIYLALFILYQCLLQKQDVLIVDQLSASIPILKFSSARIIFYCHYPDKLLTKRTSLLKVLYRLPIDFIEEITTKMADMVVVNSNFTSSVYSTSFSYIQDVPKVLYPGINTLEYGQQYSSDMIDNDRVILLSINRFERKKNIGLAIESIKNITQKSVLLVIAGGYDPRVQENVSYLQELLSLSTNLKLKPLIWKNEPIPSECNVLFVTSFTDDQRSFLLAKARLLIYTPENEHFGIVPVEAMYSRVPVICCNSGGPTETVTEETGILCDPTPDSFGAAIVKVLAMKDNKMGENGRKRVVEKFTLDIFSDNLDRMVKEVLVADNFDSMVTFYIFWGFLSGLPLVIVGWIINTF